MKPSDVLLTNGWLRSTYAALRNLSRHGLAVSVADDAGVGMCQWSRFAASVHRYPYPEIDKQEEWVGRIADICAETRARVLIPSHDETEILARYRDRLPAHVILPVASAEMLSRANDKSETVRAAQMSGVPVPALIRYSDPHELIDLCQSEKRYVIRLRKSNSSKGVFHADGKDVSDTVARCVNDLSLMPDRYPLVQEHVSGEGWGVSCLYWEGRRITHFTHRRLQEKIDSGGTSTLRAQADNSILEDMAFKLLDSMQWHGLAMVEFKYDSKTKNGWFIEINPRLWGSIGLSVAAGVEFPWLLYLCATDGPDAARKAAAGVAVKRGLTARWLLGSCIASVSSAARGKIAGAAGHLLSGKSECFDDLFLDDPLAFLGELGAYGSRLIRFRSLNPSREGMVG